MSISRRDPNDGKPAGVRVYNMKIFAQLVADAPQPKGPSDDGGPAQKSPEEARREIREEEFRRRQKRQAAQMEEQLRLSKLRAQNKQNTKFKEMVNTLEDGKTLTDAVDKFITVTEAAETTKKEQLYQDWESGVFDKLQSSVNQSVERIDEKALTKRRNEEFKKFLEASNHPSGVFLETVFEGDKEPAKPHALKARPGKIKDPVRKSLIKQRKEASLGGKEVDFTPKEREVLDARQWNAGKIEGTPYGHFAQFVGKEHRPTTRQKMMTKSDVQFDAYTYPKDGHSKSDFGPGKRVYQDKGNFHTTVYPKDGPWKEE